jgi:hypothetical protein
MQYNETPMTAVPPKLDLRPLAPISPRQEALGEMADKKRQKWIREKGKKQCFEIISLIRMSF